MTAVDKSREAKGSKSMSTTRGKEQQGTRSNRGRTRLSTGVFTEASTRQSERYTFKQEEGRGKYDCTPHYGRVPYHRDVEREDHKRLLSWGLKLTPHRCQPAWAAWG
jgi:hypothetical protein